MFGKKRKSNENQTVKLEIDSSITRQIHVMPERFYQKEKPKMSLTKIILIFGVILVCGLAGAGYFFFFAPKVNLPAINQNLNQNANENLNTNLNTEINLNTNLNQNLNANLNTEINQNTNLNQNLNINAPVLLPVLDSDEDGLTDNEEAVLGTNAQNTDSDSDGYLDKLELLSGYDPTKANGKLADSDLFKTYQGEGFSILYPSNWLVKNSVTSYVFIPEIKPDLFFLPNETSQQFISLKNFTDQTMANEWCWGDIQTNESLIMKTVVKIGLLFGRLSDNQLIYCLGKREKSVPSFHIVYQTLSNQQPPYEFFTIFNLMVKSLKILP